MDQPSARFWQIFFEVYESLPRQGPGNRASTARALQMCTDLPLEPAILDLGCGAGRQTQDLAELVALANITALDLNAPVVSHLNTSIRTRGLTGRINAIVANMSYPPFLPAGFDLIWSEGALYNVGLPGAMHICHELLKPGGYLAFSDAVWRRENPPPEIKNSFDQDYAAMGSVQDDLAMIEAGGFTVAGHFTVPDEAWWEDFYTPMEARILELRSSYLHDHEALRILDQLANEPVLHRRYSDYYAYEFFVARRLID